MKGFSLTVRAGLASAASLALMFAISGGSARAEELSEEVRSEFTIPVSALHVLVTAHHGNTYSHPGYTQIKLVTEPKEAGLYNTFTTYIGRTPADTVRWFTPEAEENAVEQPWTCKAPKQVYGFKATTRADIGETVTTSGELQTELTAKWCASANKREVREIAVERARRAREQREAAARRQAEEQRSREEGQRELERWESNCRAVGGTVVWLHVGDVGAVAPFCRSQGGGIIEVPS